MGSVPHIHISRWFLRFHGGGCTAKSGTPRRSSLHKNMSICGTDPFLDKSPLHIGFVVTLPSQEILRFLKKRQYAGLTPFSFLPMQATTFHLKSWCLSPNLQIENFAHDCDCSRLPDSKFGKVYVVNYSCTNNAVESRD